MTKMNWDYHNRCKNVVARPYRDLTCLPEVSSLGPMFQAKRTGTCDKCGRSFLAGTWIRYDADDEIVHALGCLKLPEQPR